MELTNSKRLLYSASYVTSKLTEEEQRHFSGKGSGALRKVNLLRALNVGREAHVRIGQQISLASPDTRADLERLLGASSRLAQEPAAQLAVALIVAPIPDLAVVEFARIASATAPATAKLQLLSDVYQLQMKIFPIGELYLERMEMYPIGVEKGELIFTVPMAPGESTTISHKEWSVAVYFRTACRTSVVMVRRGWWAVR